MKGDNMNGPSFFRLLLIIPACLVISSCSRAATPQPEPALAPALDNRPSEVEIHVTSSKVAEPTPMESDRKVPMAQVWQPLWDKLSQDGLGYEEIAFLFVRLGDSASQDPMGRKVQELYTTKYIKPTRKPSPPDTSPNDTGIPRPWYKGFVTEANAKRCRSFINTHGEAFREAEKEYGVPAEVAVALLFVETRLGEYLGDNNAFITLASMSVSRSPDAIPDWLQKLPGVEDRLDWVGQRMADKADWAYDELKALLVYSVENGIDPFEIPGSSYGAIGLCQFMPSNLSRFAVDGNGDGVIDLFNGADAIHSLSNYLKRHGWKENMTVAEQVKVLRRYNNLAIYANTILALAKKVEEVPGRPAVNRPLPKLPPELAPEALPGESADAGEQAV